MRRGPDRQAISPMTPRGVAATRTPFPEATVLAEESDASGTNMLLKIWKLRTSFDARWPHPSRMLLLSATNYPPWSNYRNLRNFLSLTQAKKPTEET